MSLTEKLKPSYEGYSFVSIPGSIEKLFGLPKKEGPVFPDDCFIDPDKQYDNVLIFVLDAFGWRFFNEHKDKSLHLKEFSKRALAKKLTTQFPSTTPACMTTLNTGLTVGEHGLFAQKMFSKAAGEIIAPFLFSDSKSKTRDLLLSKGITPEDVYGKHVTIAKRLKEKGIKSYVLQSNTYTPSCFANFIFDGASPLPFSDMDDAFAQLRKLVLSGSKERRYIYTYFDILDRTSHAYGPQSQEVGSVIDRLFSEINQIAQLAKALPNTTITIVSDHGQIEVDPQKTVYIDRELPGLADFFSTDQYANLLVPAGSPRCMFLHLKENAASHVQSMLERRLKGVAEIVSTKDLIDQEFFGKVVSTKLIESIGDIAILPVKNNTVWWYGNGAYEMKYKGNHGGLTSAEIETVWLQYDLA